MFDRELEVSADEIELADTLVARDMVGEEDDRHLPRQGVVRHSLMTMAMFLILTALHPSAADDGIDLVTRTLLDPVAARGSGFIDITVAPKQVSLLVTVVLDDAEADIGITRIEDPNRRILYEASFADESWDSRHFQSSLLNEPAVDTGELTVLLPTTPDVPLKAGTYRIAFETDPHDVGINRIDSIAKQWSSIADIDHWPHSIDLHVHRFETLANTATDADSRRLESDWRPALQRMLGPHALHIGVFSAKSNAAERFATLQNEDDIDNACLAMRRTAPSHLPLFVGLVPAIILTDEESGGHGGEDETSGLAPQPGNIYDEASPNGCIFIASEPWRDGSLNDAELHEILAANLVHELGHFAGLTHPTDIDGVTFDLLQDTPVCRRDDHLDCTRAEGSANVMFHSGGIENFPYTLTEAQAWVLRRHPLFRGMRLPARTTGVMRLP